MEETKLKSQNRFLKVILLLLLIPIVSAVSILGYMYLPDLISGTSEPWEKDGRTDKSNVSRSAPQKDEPAANQTASNTNASPANTTPANANVAATTASTPNTSALPFVGKWVAPAQGKLTYIFGEPKKVGNIQTGTWLVRAPEGKEYQSIYTIISSNKLQVREEGGSESRDFTYVISADGKSMELTNDGNTIHLTRSK